jgi:TonB family protein
MDLSKTNTSRFIKLALALFLAFSGNAYASQLKNVQPMAAEDSVVTVADKMPEFPDGEKALFGFMNQTVNYPAEAIKKKEQGKVTVQFVVGRTGKVENAKVLKGVSPSLDNEALRVVGLLPDWNPGEINGAKVPVYQIIPVVFRIPTEEEAWTVTDKTVVIIDGATMPTGFDTRILSPVKLASASVLKPFPKEEKSRLMAKYGHQAENGVILITSKNDDPEYALADTVIGKLDCKEPAVMPEFPGGKNEMLKFLADSIQYPFVAKELKKEGKVTVRFKVDQSGKVSDAQVVIRADYYLDREALRVISSMPNWTPGAKCSKKLSIYVTMPVTFKLDVPADEKVWEKNDKTIVLLNGKRMPSSFDLKLLNFTSLASYKVLQPETKEITKKLISQYGKDAANGVVLITTTK